MVYCLFVGAFKDSRLEALANDFHKRLNRLWPVILVPLKESPREIQKWVDQHQGRGIFVSLDPAGKTMDSTEFANWVTQNSRDLYFCAWGARGPQDGLDLSGFRKISLSPMTFSHELARVMLLEQLYRSGAILKGHPYPK
jgi:23S rRNA (pseudouridine1915-N3)-methyltransferase